MLSSISVEDEGSFTQSDRIDHVTKTSVIWSSTSGKLERRDRIHVC